MNTYHVFFELELGNHKSVLSTFTDMELAENIYKPPMKTSIFMLGRTRTKYIQQYLELGTLEQCNI